ncbi:MAG TPA: PPC domain-containing protein [Tepidisphaeraceae bacterium]|nr:PPC domain-containing protein [Tepidisphaeraceae bacterium]
MNRIRPILLIGVVVLCTIASNSIAAPKTATSKSDVPKIVAVAPLAVAAGAVTRVKIIGVKIQGAQAVLVGDAATGPATQPSSAPAHSDAPSGKIVDQRTLNLPKGVDPSREGGERVDVEISLPKDFQGSELALSLALPTGRSETVRLLVMDRGTMVDEKEPNNGFAEAQAIEPGKWVRGAIQEAGDVDVYRVSCKAGRTLFAEVLARRRHSLLDSLLVLYDAHGNIVAENDDANDADSLVRYKVPSDGDYFLAISDVNGRGNPGFPYLLSIKLAP